MTSNEFIKLFGDIDDYYIESAAEYHPAKVTGISKRRAIEITCYVIACAMLVVFGIGVMRYISTSKHQAYDINSHNGTTESIAFEIARAIESDPTPSPGAISAEDAFDLQVEEINDGAVTFSYVLKDPSYADEFYTYDGNFCLLYLVSETEEKVLIEKDPDTQVIYLNEDKTIFTIILPSDVGPLDPGNYVIYSLCYSINTGSSYTLKTSFTVPE